MSNGQYFTSAAKKVLSVTWNYAHCFSNSFSES